MVFFLSRFAGKVYLICTLKRILPEGGRDSAGRRNDISKSTACGQSLLLGEDKAGFMGKLER